MSTDPVPDGERAAIEAGCRMLGIPLDPAWMGAVASSLRVLAQQADIVLAPALPDHLDPAPVFTA